MQSASAEKGLFSDLTTDYRRDAIGLALSGGGYRAALFHGGVVLRLGELGLLPKLDRISSVSGGSITSGILAKAWPELRFEDGTGRANPERLITHFIEPLFAATARSLDVRVSIAGFLPFTSAGNRLADLYDRFIFKGMKLAEMPQRPKFIFNATNIQTGGLIRFTRDYIADWRALKSTTKAVRVADAAAASSAFPPVLAPLRLDLSDEDVVTPPGARFDDRELRERPVLLDGGIYDNLGLESIWKRCGVILASYAGHNAEAEPSNFTIDHLLPMIYAFLASSIDQRERLLVALFKNILADGLPERAGAYWTAGTPMSAFPKTDGWGLDAPSLERARLMPTRLDAIDRDDQRNVVLAGYTFADRSIRSYLMPEAAAPTGAPDLP